MTPIWAPISSWEKPKERRIFLNLPPISFRTLVLFIISAPNRLFIRKNEFFVSINVLITWENARFVKTDARETVEIVHGSRAHARSTGVRARNADEHLKVHMNMLFFHVHMLEVQMNMLVLQVNISKVHVHMLFFHVHMLEMQVYMLEIQVNILKAHVHMLEVQVHMLVIKVNTLVIHVLMLEIQVNMLVI